MSACSISIMKMPRQKHPFTKKRIKHTLPNLDHQVAAYIACYVLTVFKCNKLNYDKRDVEVDKNKTPLSIIYFSITLQSN